nr:16S rRNA pseudouridine(516) synthase [Granulicatella sp. zg-84]
MIRLDKFLVDMGVGSRKDVRELIKKKQVQVNGEIAKKADDKIDGKQDEVMCQGVVYHYTEYDYIMLNKPQGVVSATEDKIHQTVLDLLDKRYHRVAPVGRLDKDTQGLLLLTNDGALAHDLLSPKKHVDKRYEVHLKYPIQEDLVLSFEEGIILEDGYKCLPAKLTIKDSYCVFVTIQEGKFHQVKRMFQALNNKVVFLKRLSMGSLQLDETLPIGAYRELTIEELEHLKKGR